MRKITDRFNILLIIGNILLLITTIGLIFTEDKINNIMASLYWIGVNINLFGILLYLSKWTKGGTDVDRKGSKRILNDLSNIVVSFEVCYFLVYLAIVFCTNIGVLENNNLVVIILFYLFTLFAESILVISVEKAYKETIKAVKKVNYGKNDSNDR